MSSKIAIDGLNPLFLCTHYSYGTYPYRNSKHKNGNNLVDFALLKDGKLVEFHKEIEDNKFHVGDIFLAKVKKTLSQAFWLLLLLYLHSMKDLDDGRYNKVANIVGHTMQYHPHGDASIA